MLSDPAITTPDQVRSWACVAVDAVNTVGAIGSVYSVEDGHFCLSVLFVWLKEVKCSMGCLWYPERFRENCSSYMLYHLDPFRTHSSDGKLDISLHCLHLSYHIKGMADGEEWVG